MKALLFILLLLIIPIALAYPSAELPAIMQEKYPNATIGKNISFQDDGNGVYIRYSVYPIPTNAEMETLWQTVQDKRNATAKNKKIAETIKIKYITDIQYLEDIKTDTAIIRNQTTMTEVQQTNNIRKLADYQYNLADIIQDILRFMRWYYWDNT